MAEQTNEPGPADGDRKIEAQATQNFDTQYQDLLKKEQEANDARVRAEATANFDGIRKLGFATKQDIDENIKGIFGKFVSEIEAMRQENTKLREWVMRAKMQGLNSGATDEKPQSTDNLAAYKRFKW